MKTDLALAAVWTLLALATLWLVVQDSSSLVAALVAWAGGIFTVLIAQRLWDRYQA